MENKNNLTSQYLVKTSHHVFKLDTENENLSYLMKVVPVRKKEGTVFFKIDLVHDAIENTLKIKSIYNLKKFTNRDHYNESTEKHYIDISISKELFETYTSKKYKAIKSHWNVKDPSGKSEEMVGTTFRNIAQWIEDNFDMFEEHSKSNNLWQAKTIVNLEELIKTNKTKFNIAV